MGSPATTGVDGDTWSRSDLTFSERSAVKLALIENDPAVAESGDAGGTIATAQALAPTNLSVPNPLVSGEDAGLGFDVDAFNVTGSISTLNDVDWYSFTGLQDELSNFELMSQALDRISDDLDPSLEVYDATGSLVAYYASTASNDDEFETFDSILIDLVLPADDAYFLWAAVTPLSVGGSAKTGDYELFGYTFTSVPEPASWLLLLAGAGFLGVLYRLRAPTSPH
jgi:hypothetical protein